MRYRLRFLRPIAALACCLACVALAAHLPAQEPQPAPDKGAFPARRIYVPLDELDVVFDRDSRGVVMPRDEFLKLYAAAKKNREDSPRPTAAFVVSRAEYKANVVDDQLVLQVSIEFTQFAPGWQAVPLPFRGVAVESATLDGEPAQLGRAPDGEKQLLLLLPPDPAPVAEKGRGAVAAGVQILPDPNGKHTLKLDLSANLVTAGSDQATEFGFPSVPSATFEITLPAGKNLRVDELPLERPAAIDQPAAYSVAIGGKSGMALRITDRETENSAAALVFATTAIGVHVAPEELTWRAVTTLQVYGTPIDSLQFSIPKSLDIVAIESTGLERWEIAPGPNESSTLLKLAYRQKFQESRTITFKGVASTVIGQPWSVPTLTLSNATSQIAHVLVQHPSALRLQVVETTGVRRVAAEENATAGTPPTADMPTVDPTLALHFAAWHADFSLVFVTQPKAREIQATIATRIDIDSRELALRSSINVQSRFAPLFELDLTIPAEWIISDVLVGKAPALWRVVPLEAGLHQVRISLVPPVPADGAVELTVNARQIPAENWPVEEAPLIVKLPEVYLPQAGVTEGTYMIAADNDLEIVPEELTGLDPSRLPAGQQQLENAPRLVYEYQDTRFSGRLKVVRKPARLAARTVAFHRLDPQTLVSHLEARLAVSGGGLRKVQVALPEAAGTDLQFHLMGGALRIVEQIAAEPVNGQRLWTLQFDQRASGRLWLAVDLQHRRGKDVKKFQPPALRIPAAERQDGYIALEAGPDQQLTIAARNAAGQPLTEIDPADMPAPVGYAPRERIVAAYHAVLPGQQITLSETRFDRLAVPTAICDRSELTSVLGESGEFQHQAQFLFRAVGVQSLSLQLPAESTLWATLIDGQPIEVRHFGSDVGGGVRYLVPLTPSNNPEAQRTLQLFYRTSVSDLKGAGTLRQEPPGIAVVNGAGETQPLEILARSWDLYTPAETDLVQSSGAFEPVEKLMRESLLGRLQRSIAVGSRDELLEKGLAILIVVAIIGVLTIAARRQRMRRLVLGLLLGGIMIGAFSFIFMNIVQQSYKSARSKPASAPVAIDTIYSEDESDARSDMSGREVTNLTSDQAGIRAGSAATEMHVRAGSEPESEMALDAKTADEKPTEEAMPAASESPPSQPVGEASALVPGREMAANQPGVPAGPAGGDKPAAGMGGGVGGGGGALAPQAPAPVVADPAHAVDANKANAGGLLSLALQIQPPADSRKTQFQYIGKPVGETGPGLELAYQNRRALTLLDIALQMAVVLLFWFLRKSPPFLRAGVGVLGLVAPLALSSVVPLGVLPYLDGIFLGTLFGLGLWLTLALSSCCCVSCNGIVRAGAKNWATYFPLAALAAAGVLATVTVHAAEPAPNAAPAANAKPMPRPVIDRDTLVIPYDPADDPLKSDRVFLPYEKFVEIWDDAHPEKRRNAAPPADGVVTEALYAATIVPQDVKPGEKPSAQAEITARIVVFNFRDDQITLALPLGPVALTSAELDGKAAPIITRDTPAGPEFAIVLEDAGLHVVDCKFNVPVEQNGPAGKFTLPLRSVPAGAVRFTLPGKDLKLKVNGAGGLFRHSDNDGKPVAIVPIDKGGDLTLSWGPAQTRDAVEGIVHADAATAVVLDDAGVKLSSGFQLNVRQGALAEVSFSLPPELSVRQIAGPDVGGWEIAGEDAQRTLKVFLRRRVTDSTSLVFDLFMPHSFTEEAAPVIVPQFAPLGLTRETGTVAVYTARQFAVTAGAVTGLAQIDAAQFAPSVKIARPDSPPQLAYRYATRPFQLQLLAARQTPLSQGTAEHALLVAPRKVRVWSRMELSLAGAPRSEISLQLPEGYLLYDLQSSEVADYYVEKRAAEGAKQGGVLHVELTAPRTGLVTLAIDGIIPRQPDDLKPQLGVPAPLAMNELRSSAAVWLDPIYSGNLQEFVGWKSIDPEQLSARLRALRTSPVQFAFTSTGTLPQPIGIALKQAVPVLSADSLTTIVAGETAVQYLLSLQWTIAQAAETTFHFTTPDWLEGKLDFSGNRQGLRVRQVASEKIDGKRLRWTITLEEPRRDRYFVTARAILPPPSAPGTIEGPAVAFEQEKEKGGQFESLATQQRFLVLVNQSPYQLDRPADAAAESVTADQLPIKVSPALVEQAAEILKVGGKPGAVNWQVRALQQLTRLAASVNLAEMVLVVAADGSWRAQANYRINNRSRQFLALRMPEGSTELSLFVAGRPSRPVRTRRNNAEVLLVPLPKTAAGDLAAEVKLVYAGRFVLPLPRGVQIGRMKMDLPAPRVLSQEEDAVFGIPVARTAWTVYLPKDLDVKPLDDSDRTNVVESIEGQERLVAELNEALQLFNDLAPDSGYNSYARIRADNNLKQLGVSIENERSRLHGIPAGQSDQKSGEIAELYGKWQTAQQQLAQQPSSQQQPAQQLGRDGQPSAPSRAPVKLNINTLEQDVLTSNAFTPPVAGDESRKADDAFNIPSDIPAQLPAATVPNAAPKDQKPAGNDGKGQGKGNFNRSQLRAQAESQSLALNAAKAQDLEQSEMKETEKLAEQSARQPQAAERVVTPSFARGQRGDGERKKNSGNRPVPTTEGYFLRDDKLNADDLIQFGFEDQRKPEIAGVVGGDEVLAFADQPRARMGDADEKHWDREQYGRVAIAPAAWSRAGGLSLLIDVPKDGQELVFSKVGGDPKLAVGLRPLASIQFGFGLAWMCIWLGIGFSLILALSRPNAGAAIRRRLPVILMAVGLAWFFLLPAAMLGLVLFVLGAIAFGWQHRREAA